MPSASLLLLRPVCVGRPFAWCSCYTQDSETQTSLSSSNKTFAEALDAFTQANHAALKSVGKSAVVWEGSPSSTHLYYRD
jgi:hypothetical protein